LRADLLDRELLLLLELDRDRLWERLWDRRERDLAVRQLFHVWTV